jgi:hypothetical protein
MRISKLWSAICAASFLAGALAVRAQDNPAQAAARAALVEKMGEPNAQPSPPTNQMMAPAIVVTPSGTAVAQPSPPANQTTATATPPETPPAPAGANDTPAQAAARAALMEKMGQPDAQQNRPANAMTASPPPVKPMPAETQPASVPAVHKTTSPRAAVAPVRTTKPVTAPVPSADNSGIFTPVPPPSNPGVQPGVNAAPTGTPPSSYQWQNPPPAKPAAPAVAPAVKPVPANAGYAGKILGFKPVEAPPPPVSAQKVAELQALLARYMANQVSPDEYQKERAAILAEP